MDERRCWKYCVVGNIVKTHIDAEGILRCGSPQYTGGTKVYLSGRHWDRTLPRICVLGLNRCRKYQVNDIPVELIENVRCGRTFKPSVLNVMNDLEFRECWWHDTNEDRKAVREFAKMWNETSKEL